MSQQQFDSPDEALAHFGVKGMKWGVRKSDESGGGKITRKQNRQMNREASAKFYADKATMLYNEGKKHGDRILIETRVPGDYAVTVMTGKEFARGLERGGAFDVKTTEIFARQPKAGEQFVLNDQKIGVYKNQNFRKGR